MGSYDIDQKTREIVSAAEGSWSTPIYVIAGILSGWGICFLTITIAVGDNYDPEGPTPLPIRLAYMAAFAAGGFVGYLIGRAKERRMEELRDIVRSNLAASSNSQNTD